MTRTGYLAALALITWAAADTQMARAQQPAAPAPATAPAPIPAAPADPKALLTETVGVLAGMNLYQSYLTIGLLADGKAERLYDEKAARSVLASVLTSLATVDQQLEKAGAAMQTAGDQAALAKVRGVVGLLRRQGKELIAFWDSGRPEDGARYEATRQEAWKQIVALLGLDKK
jgi:hypothetical protein